MENTKTIGRFELTALIVGATIGSGIFGISSDLANAAAPGPAILEIGRASCRERV